MKSTHPGILDEEFSELYKSDNGGNGKSKHSSRNDNLFYEIAQNARDLILHAQLVPELKFDYVSPSSIPISGYTPEEFYADPLLVKNCIHPDDLHLIVNPSHPGVQLPTEPVEIRWIRKDGVILWTEHMITYTRDEEGNLVACQIIARDITERKKAEDALLESQQFNASLLENAPLATVVISPDTSIKYVNPAWVRLNGWTLAEVVGQKAPYPWWPDQFKEAFSSGFKESMNSGSGKAEIVSQKKSGELYWIDMNWAPVTKNGELSYLLINSIDITERKQAEKALQDSEEKFSRAFNSSPDIMAITTVKDGRYIEVNESFTRVTGFTREETIGHTPAELHAWANKEDRTKMLKMLKEQGRVYSQEFGFRVKSGEIHNMLFSIEQIKIGDEPCLISVCNDITERKQAEKALHDSEEKFSKAFHASPEIIAITTIKDDKYLDINESYTHYTGYTREELLDRTVGSTSIWNKPGDRAEMLQILEEQGGIRNKEYEFRTKSGEIRTRLFSAEPITIGGEKCLLSASTDITERKQMEEALKSSEENYRELISTSLDGIISMDSKMKITIWNQGAETIFGYTEEEMLGQNIFKIVPENVRESMLGKNSNMAEADLTPPMNHTFESIGQKKDGTIIPIDLSLTSRKVDGKFVATAIIRDISERKRMEETLADEAIRRRILIEQSSDGIVIIDQNGKVYDVNRRFADMLGYTMEEALKLNIWDWDFQWTPEVLLEKIKNVNSDGDHFTTLHKRKDGTVYDVDISTNGATFAGQKLVFCVCRDISERTLIEKALRESEEKFSLAFNASPHMIIITDVTDGKYIEVNDSFVDCTGYTREEFIGHNVSEFDLWDKPEEMEKMTRLVQEHGRFRNEEYDFRTKSGEIRTWLCSADVVSIGGQMRMLAVAVDITERKKTQEALRESEERFSRAFNASPISLSISRLGDGIFLEVNESFLRDKGYTRDEVIGHSSKKLRIWATQEEQNRIMDMLKKQGRVHNEQVQYRTKSGYIRTGLISAEVISIGNESCMLILNNDITQQKQAEEQLRLLSSVTKQVSDATIVTDPEFRINFMNQAAEDLFGYSTEEVRSKDLRIFNKTHPTDETKQLIRRTLAAGKVYSAIVTKQHKNGTTIICDCRLSPLYDEKGQICSLIDVQRDITKQKDVEDKLQEHKKLIDSILATMPEGVLVIDSKDRILLANKALYQVLHLNRKSLKNNLLSEVLPVDQYFNLHHAVKDGQNESNTLEFRYHGQGFEKIIYCIIVKMDSERTLLTFSDVSKEREEEEKLYLTDRLASIGEMAAGLAHELNNPLTGILTLSQLLVSSETLEENKEDLECIYSEAKRAAGIVKNVLLFARNKTDDTGRASVNEVIKDVLRLREYEERASNIKVLTDLEENIPDIPIDKGQLQQVFLNIISNAEAAIKEANRPGILTVASQCVNNHINILFTDNGCGIKKQIMPRLFDPFFTTKEVGKGTGLGLSICYSIIVKHGGKITVKSQVNEGSTFTIRMPIEM